jgi:hypothetical protein
MPWGHTVNKTMYRDFFTALRDATYQKHLELWRTGNRVLHHNKASNYWSQVVDKYLVKHNITMHLQPPYFPNMFSLGRCFIFWGWSCIQVNMVYIFYTMPILLHQVFSYMLWLTLQPTSGCIHNTKHNILTTLIQKYIKNIFQLRFWTCYSIQSCQMSKLWQEK